MFARIAQFSVAALLAAGGAVIVPGAASAAAKPCYQGSWTLGKYTYAVRSDQLTIDGSGAAGTKLKIDAKGVAYDFAKSRRVVGTATDDGYTGGVWTQYSGKLALGAAFTGKTSGRFTLRLRTAKGDAVARSGIVGKSANKSYKLAKSYRNGVPESIAPVMGRYTCSKHSLHEWSSLKDTQGGTYKLDLWYRR